MANWMLPPGARVEDRISKLPDKVLCHILSFMPTKYVVRTSAVSRRWNNLWASVPSLDFEHRAQPCMPYLMMTKTGSSGDFFTFVDRVISLRDQSDIRRFRLHCSCDGEDFPRIEAWIRTATGCNVVELDLRIETDCEESEEPALELPQCVFMCRTLVALRLTSNCVTCNPPASGCFQSLKVLHAKFEYPDNDLMENFFACCPVLEHLTVEALLGLDVTVNFKLAAPELKTFRLALPHSSSFDDDDDDDYEYSIFMNCPKLEFFDLKQDVLSNYSFENAKFLVTARVDLLGHGVETLDLEPQFSTRATELLAGISNVKDLYLSAHVLEGCCVPAFDNLKKLELILDDCYNGDLLTQLLSSSPNLEYLVLDHEPLDKEAICTEQQNPADEEGPECKKWKAPEFVPLCLLSHLKTISMMGFHGHLHEKEVVKYLLENGEVLHRMTIYICGFPQAEEDIYKEFSLFPRASRTCQVEFIDYKDETCRF